MTVRAGMVLLLAATGCQEPGSDAEVGVSWELESGTCADVGADTFRLTVGGAGAAEATVTDAGCADGSLALTFPIGRTVTFAADLLAGKVPVSRRLDAGGEFTVVPGGADVSFRFALEDFLHTADYRFKTSYTGALTCSAAGVSAQRVTLTPAVDGAEVCGPDAICVPTDGTDGPCRENAEVQTIADLPWGHYRLGIVGVAPTSCFVLDNAPITVDFSTLVHEFVVDRTGAPCE
jgi:hypothetical protein